jgi:hypothetical protein
VLNVPLAKAVPPVPSNPTTFQVIVELSGQGESGVHVNTVAAAFHTAVTDKIPVGGVVVKIAWLIEVFIAALKVKTTGVVPETPVAPLAGLLLTVTPWAQTLPVSSASADNNFGYSFMISFQTNNIASKSVGYSQRQGLARGTSLKRHTPGRHYR